MEYIAGRPLAELIPSGGLAVDPSMDPLAGNPRFQAVVRRMGLAAR